MHCVFLILIVSVIGRTSATAHLCSLRLFSSSHITQPKSSNKTLIIVQHELSPNSVMRRVKTLAASPSAPRFNCWFAAQAFVLVASNEGKIEQLGGDAATVLIRPADVETVQVRPQHFAAPSLCVDRNFLCSNVKFDESATASIFI
ncbi:hypothetical protein Y032_0031g2428 [Ancylostoma ceylanicum]|uniref:Secreted protein n=1 Tax=Ancylostoma ceylanicum TaxID=53326 RepID=A0A016UQ79_9BILA|nr:hypothetical protein Y032_0031g2428 [Ancylostoma ceylanicum]